MIFTMLSIASENTVAELVSFQANNFPRKSTIPTMATFLWKMKLERLLFRKDFNMRLLKLKLLLEKKLAKKRDLFYINLFATKYSAICTALVAAPFLKLSATIQRLMVLS